MLEKGVSDLETTIVDAKDGIVTTKAEIEALSDGINALKTLSGKKRSEEQQRQRDKEKRSAKETQRQREAKRKRLKAKRSEVKVDPGLRQGVD